VVQIHGPRVQPRNSTKSGEHAVVRIVAAMAVTTLNVVDRWRARKAASPTINAHVKPTENGMAD
jgi:hypothetical protein